MLKIRSIPAGQVAIQNAFHGSRPPLTFTVDGLKGQMSFQSKALGEGDEPDVVLGLTFGDEPGWIAFGRPVFSSLIERFDEQLASHPTAHAALALETLFASSLDALEEKAGRPILLTSVLKDIPDEEAVIVDFNVDIEHLGSSRGSIGLSTAGARLLATMIDGQPTSRHGGSDLYFPVAVCLAASRLSVDELTALQAGDVILVENIAESSAKPLVVVGDHLIFPASFGPRGLKIEGAATRARGSALEWCMEQQPESSSQNASDKTEIGDLPVKVTFEIGRLELTLAEVQRLGSGSVLPLGKPVDQAVDIVANGRKIGRGSIVSIGDSIGVEVTRIFSGR
ncbi:putative translocation protein Y4yK [Agaricicola taiwanensis]|uniref:Putative translocation protein Y4yK n=1 Tax=Agaricicola taiwanensis TaxID=591372 RepID=A0A8J2VLE6_9RHOB|nr:type III secretion system cytoplasmic ring protein SctQ [Agaricicola taiwanensis]GGE35946.1 putative translocation protein Y4yK [Agaricicola taiwanensis]